MMSSCCTLRLKRRKAFSRDSLSWMMTSATLYSPPIRFGLVSCGGVLLRSYPHRPWRLSHVRCFEAHGQVAGHLLINSGYGSQAIFLGGGGVGAGGPKGGWGKGPPQPFPALLLHFRVNRDPAHRRNSGRASNIV